MKTLYFSCEMGAAGDMLMGALLEVHPDPQGALGRLNEALWAYGVTVSAAPSVKCGVRGTHVTVLVRGDAEGETPAAHPHEHEHAHPHDHDHAHHHTHDHESAHHAPGCASLADVEHIFAHLSLPDKVRADALAVYRRIAEAESAVHGQPVELVHFHEVGALDAIADVCGVCLLMAELAPARVVCSPIHVGSGQVRCAHGLLPVPAPATARLLAGAPIYGGSIQGELCTPTGAALLGYFANEFGPLPALRLECTGYGMGSKDFEAANCVRALLGESGETGETLFELRCDLDDMTPEALGFAQERLWEGGALDVYTLPIGMKKNRPGVMLCCLCRAAQREALLGLFFRHTTTLGVRAHPCERYALTRTERVVQTPGGPVRLKAAQGYGAAREKAEYEDLARIARERDCSLAEAAAFVRDTFQQKI